MESQHRGADGQGLPAPRRRHGPAIPAGANLE